jgi:hypothetical protein
MSEASLIHAEAHLNAGLIAHSAYRLLLATCILDPIGIIDYDEYDEDDFAWSWKLMMDEFPEIYAQAITHLYSPGSSPKDLYPILERGLSDIGIETDGYESLHWVTMYPEGIGVGWEADDIEVADQLTRPGVRQTLWLFGCKYTADSVKFEPSAHNLARSIFKEFLHHEDIRWHDLACAVAWVFSASGNTSFDYSASEVLDLGSDYVLSRDHIEFIGDINIEGVQFWRAAQDGFAYIRDHINDLGDTYLSVLRDKARPKKGGKQNVRKSNIIDVSVGITAGAAAAA